jgi:hypothetical protein
MHKQKSKLGIIFVAIYITLAVTALTFLVVMLTKYPEKSEFAGVYIGVLTLPWSIISTNLARTKIVNSITGLILMFAFFSIINTFILYWFGKKIGKNL